MQYGQSFSLCSETLPEDEETSIKTYKGYYIGRYEAGDKESTESKTLRTSSNTSNTVTIKKGQAPYNHVTRNQAKDLAEKMATEEEYKATTKLVSSYAWDTAINFIQKTNSNYGKSSAGGNYVNMPFTYTDIKGASHEKGTTSNLLVPTGQTTAVNNIYDLGGNAWDWTTESFSNAKMTCILRGGNYSNSSTSCPAGFRNCDSTTTSSESITFRVTLFM